MLVSYAIMLVYVTFSLGSFPAKHGKPTWLIGISGILIVALSVVIGYSATSYLGVKSSMISLEVIPFLILAIGVDNMFIITQAVDREPHRTLEIKIARAVEECSPSILVACITEIVTFAVGITTNIPALKVFCMTAVFAILANFVLQMTAFIAILAFDMKRTAKKPLDADEHDGQAKSNRVQQAFTQWFTPFVKRRVVNLVVLVVAVIMVAFAWPAFDKLKLGLEQQISVRTDGVLFKVGRLSPVLRRSRDLLRVWASRIHRDQRCHSEWGYWQLPANLHRPADPARHAHHSSDSKLDGRFLEVLFKP